MNEEIKNIINATSMGKLEKQAVIKSLLDLHNVVGQSEQLIAFSKWKEEKGYNPIYDHKGLVEEYMKIN